MRKRGIVLLLATTLVLSGCGNAKEKRENQDAYRQIGINCMAEGDYDGAITAFQKALDQSLAKIGEIELDTCYYKAEAQYRGGYVEDAIDTYTALIRYDKKNADAYYLRGALYLGESNLEQAKEDFANAVNYANGNYAIYVNIAQQLESVGENSQAKEYLEAALKLDGKTAEANTWRGRIYLMQKEYDKAEEELKSALEKESDEANLYMGEVCVNKGDEAGAEQYFSNYLEKNEKDTTALEKLADIYMKRSDFASAVSYLEKALEVENPYNKQSLQKKLVQSYEYSGDFASAKKLMADYVEEYPTDEEAARENEFLQTR